MDNVMPLWDIISEYGNTIRKGHAYYCPVMIFSAYNAAMLGRPDVDEMLNKKLNKNIEVPEEIMELEKNFYFIGEYDGVFIFSDQRDRMDSSETKLRKYLSSHDWHRKSEEIEIEHYHNSW